PRRPGRWSRPGRRGQTRAAAGWATRGSSCTSSCTGCGRTSRTPARKPWCRTPMSDAPLAYLNGRLVPFADAGLPLSDAGFVSGATVVDNARTFRHELFRWPDHLARFRRDCTACYVPLEATDEQLTATAEELVAHNARLLPPGGELQLVTFATPGPLGFYLGEASDGPATLGMATYPLPFARYRRFFTEGATLAVAGMQHSDPADLLPP